MYITKAEFVFKFYYEEKSVLPTVWEFNIALSRMECCKCMERKSICTCADSAAVASDGGFGTSVVLYSDF
jgi:hypothetical protein